MTPGTFDKLNTKPVVNAAGPVTRMGGHRLHPEVAAAMAQAAQLHLPIDRLQEEAGALIGTLSGAQGGYVTAGAAAGIVLAAAATIAGDDVVAMRRLPDTRGLSATIIVQRTHMNSYLRLLRLAGARLVEVGNVGHPGKGRVRPWHLESAIDECCCAIAHSPYGAAGSLGLEQVAAIAHRHSLPVIVDAAASLPPVENLRRFIEQGADLVAFSGGKGLGGPQGSGIVCGRADLIRSIALQQQDMDVQEATWCYRDAVAQGIIAGPPDHGIGRPMKVGKETIVGLIVALRRFVAGDHEPAAEDDTRKLRALLDALPKDGGLRASIERPRGTEAHPVLALTLLGPDASRRAAALALALREHDPPVYLNEDLIDEGTLRVVPTTILSDEVLVIVSALTQGLQSLPSSEGAHAPASAEDAPKKGSAGVDDAAAEHWKDRL